MERCQEEDESRRKQKDWKEGGYVHNKHQPFNINRNSMQVHPNLFVVAVSIAGQVVSLVNHRHARAFQVSIVYIFLNINEIYKQIILKKYTVS